MQDLNFYQPLIRSAILGDESEWRKWRLSRPADADYLPDELRFVCLAYHKMKSTVETDPDFKIFKGWMRRGFYSNSLLLRAARKVSTYLDQKNIDHCFIKGVPLMTIYPKTSARMLGDIDILVQPEDVDTVLQYLFKNDWEADQNPIDRTYRRQNHAVNLRSPNDSISLDLHWKMFRWHHPSTVDASVIQQRTIRNYRGCSFSVANADDLFFHIVGNHSISPMYASYHWMPDVFNLSRQEDIDFDKVLKRCRETNLTYLFQRQFDRYEKIIPGELKKFKAALASQPYKKFERTVYEYVQKDDAKCMFMLSVIKRGSFRWLLANPKNYLVFASDVFRNLGTEIRQDKWRLIYYLGRTPKILYKALLLIISNALNAVKVS